MPPPLRYLSPCLMLGAIMAFPARAAEPESTRGCRACHQGIEPIREAGSEMLKQIVELGESAGDPQGCVVCHGGDPRATDRDSAHRGPEFYPAPASPWINEKTCGQCHEEHVGVQWHSLMMTEAGKIQGVAWSFGGLTGYEHRWGNYDVENPKDPKRRWGTDLYRAYMQRLKTLEPQVFVDRHEALPAAPTDLSQRKDHPELAAFTYLRNQCQRCHHSVKGREARGDFRGIGCASCHMPYSTEGFYEGGDPSVPRDKTGHVLVHSIQSSRKAKVQVHGTQYSGIPINTCTVCHNRGKRIGVSFQGLMETPYASPYAPDGSLAPELRGKHYLAGHVAMEVVQPHIRKIECYTCHSSWSPQCYGCHVRFDYSGNKSSFDWLAAGHRHARPECAADRGESGYDTKIPRVMDESRSYTRWEEPILGINGEGRVTPIAPGCQPVFTVIGPDGQPILHNKIFRTPAGTEGGGEEGQLAIDMSPTQPHTMTKEGRSCESCHLSGKALGYGLGSGKMTHPPDQPLVVDLETAEQKVCPPGARQHWRWGSR